MELTKNISIQSSKLIFGIFISYPTIKEVLSIAPSNIFILIPLFSTSWFIFVEFSSYLLFIPSALSKGEIKVSLPLICA